MSQTQGEMKRDPRYNVTGVISNLQVKQDKDGKDYAVFKLVRAGKRTISAIAWDDKAESLLSNFAEGDTVKTFGFFKKRSFVGDDGTTVNMSQLNVLWSGVPAPAKTEQGTQAEQKVAA
ncbi:hypothetical protein CKO28_20470 [Rhodovibrio sodomensis]|uniref:Single-stranded DNA-binding protein n=1 Tax=Rhodovibrio sodomensis TaxID=1088 RepID=A0ABS1DKF2_9PROT|nr:hypothetical protein [Rhodovibrio sodomensis]MBK1670402.1 hypothetical protein [Rhodovibrio sodomensis]